MLLITYSHTDSKNSCRDKAALAAHGVVLLHRENIEDAYSLPNRQCVICPLDSIEDVQYLPKHLVDHKRVLFQIDSNRLPEGFHRDNNHEYFLLSPRATDKTLWRLACAHDVLSETQQAQWNREWDLVTRDLLANRLLSGVTFIRSVGESFYDSLPGIKSFI